MKIESYGGRAFVHIMLGDLPRPRIGPMPFTVDEERAPGPAPR